MWYEPAFDALVALRNPERAVKMEAYMRNQYPFLGISAPVRKKVYRSTFKMAEKEKRIDFDFVRICFDQETREFHYMGADYLLAIQGLLQPEHLPLLKEFILTKSWWDTVDSLDGVVGSIVNRYPDTKETMLAWSTNENIWVRRVAIDHQLLFKEGTDAVLLGQIIENNLLSTEFFINKAIGWSLRDYSKTNPAWVQQFIEAHRPQMAPLSIREGSKYLVNTKKPPIH